MEGSAKVVSRASSFIRNMGYTRFRQQRAGNRRMPSVKNIGKPCALIAHARFDEGGQARACSLLYPYPRPHIGVADNATIDNRVIARAGRTRKKGALRTSCVFLVAWGRGAAAAR